MCNSTFHKDVFEMLVSETRIKQEDEGKSVFTDIM